MRGAGDWGTYASPRLGALREGASVLISDDGSLDAAVGRPPPFDPPFPQAEL